MVDSLIYGVVVACYLVVVLSQMLVVVLENRQPVKTVAWLMVVFFLPVVGLILYFFFGQNRKRHHFVSRACASQLERRAAARYYQGGVPELPGWCEHMICLFRRQNGAYPYAHSRVQLFYEGQQMLDTLLADIAAARHHIHLESYIIEDDEVGNRVARALADKARQGVNVRVIYDDVGCWSVKNRFFRAMQDAGIHVRPFLPVRFPKLTSKVDFRNHRKIVVIDGLVGYVGGMNLADRYVRATRKYPKPWRDTHMRLMGNVVGGLQRAFLSDWYVAAGQSIGEQVYYPREDETERAMATDSNPCVSSNALVQVVTSMPSAPWPDIMQGMVLAIMRAKRYCYLQSPYFMPTERVLFALQTAALSGVDVRLMVPRRTDKLALTRATRSFLPEALRAGVKVYLYQGTFLHAKTLVCDDELVSCGSTNIDFRSFERNFEVNAFVYDRAVALSFRAQFESDQERCRLLRVNQDEQRPLGVRIRESLVRLLAPLL